MGFLTNVSLCVEGQSRNTTEMYPGKVMHIIGG